MFELLRRFRRARYKYTRLVDVRVYRENILHNLHEFQTKYATLQVAPVLKSNAYGHGLIEVAKMVDQESLPFLCVDAYFEALMLRNNKITSPILILGYTPVENILESMLSDISFAIIGIDQARAISLKVHSPRTFHLEIDTGMHRHGIMPNELEEVFGLISKNPNIRIEGLFTHFAEAETPGSSLAAMQVGRWKESIEIARRALTDIKYLHCGGTPSGFYATQLEATVLRLGIGLYGVNISQDKLDLRPALEITSRITSIRTLPAHERIGYSGTFETKTPMRVASIPLGYAEGLDRRLSNRGSILIHGIPCPIVGRVSMNITSVDVSNVPEATVDDEVVVVSKDTNAPNSMEAIARIAETIPYDIMVGISPQLHRTVCSTGAPLKSY